MTQSKEAKFQSLEDYLSLKYPISITQVNFSVISPRLCVSARDLNLRCC